MPFELVTPAACSRPSGTAVGGQDLKAASQASSRPRVQASVPRERSVSPEVACTGMRISPGRRGVKRRAEGEAGVELARRESKMARTCAAVSRVKQEPLDAQGEALPPAPPIPPELVDAVDGLLVLGLPPRRPPEPGAGIARRGGARLAMPPLEPDPMAAPRAGIPAQPLPRPGTPPGGAGAPAAAQPAVRARPARACGARRASARPGEDLQKHYARWAKGVPGKDRMAVFQAGCQAEALAAPAPAGASGGPALKRLELEALLDRMTLAQRAAMLKFLLDPMPLAALEAPLRDRLLELRCALLGHLARRLPSADAVLRAMSLARDVRGLQGQPPAAQALGRSLRRALQEAVLDATDENGRAQLLSSARALQGDQDLSGRVLELALALRAQEMAALYRRLPPGQRCAVPAPARDVAGLSSLPAKQLDAALRLRAVEFDEVHRHMTPAQRQAAAQALRGPDGLQDLRGDDPVLAVALRGREMRSLLAAMSPGERAQLPPQGPRPPAAAGLAWDAWAAALRELG